MTDLDNDGIGDILIDGRVFFHVLRGTGGGHFVYQNDAWGKITHTAEASVDGGFAFGDIDADGDLDLMGFTAGDPNRQVELYRNDLPAQHWLNVRPVGLPGNKPGVNSQIRIFEAGTDKLLWYEEVLAFSKQAQQNYYAFDQLERHYGLGDKTSVDVTITFYPSGTTVRKNGAMADSTIVIGEDGTNGVVEPPKPKPVDPAGGAAQGGNNQGGTAQGGAGQGTAAQGGAAQAGAPQAGSPAGGSTAGGSTAAGGSTSAAGGAATNNASPSSDAGCGCRVGARTPAALPHNAWGFAALLLLGSAGRRRAASRRRARR
jgi:hypothetical protein